MLILTRNVGQEIMIGEDISLMILGSSKNQVRIGINAPKDVTILRKEIFDRYSQIEKAKKLEKKDIHIDDNEVRSLEEIKEIYEFKNLEKETRDEAVKWGFIR